MIAKELEANLVSAIDVVVAALPYESAAATPVYGSWQPAQLGLVRWLDDRMAPASVEVSVATPANDTYTSPEAVLSAFATLRVRYELDPQGVIFLALASALESLFFRWQADLYQAAFHELDIPTFSVDAVSISGGARPIVDRDAGFVSLSFPIELRGTFRTVPLNQNN